MHYLAAAETDIGIKKQTNQDSILIKHGESERGEVLLAVICDGMGGLEKGELASATVIRAFADWFDEDLPYELRNPNPQVIGGKCSLLLKDLNLKISEYGKSQGVRMGTTFTGILLIEDMYIVLHIGDTRLYHIDTSIEQLTTDQTFVEREINRGTLSIEQARTDKRRNMLLQCIGASEKIEPEQLTGKVVPGTYMLCSDGFRHKISSDEIYEKFKPSAVVNKEMMHKNARFLIDTAKSRQEKDNISVILIRADK